MFQKHVALLNTPYDDKYVEFDRDIAEDKLQSDLGKCYIWGLSRIHNISQTVLTYASEVQRLEVENVHLWDEQPKAAAYIDWESWYHKETGCLAAKIQELWQLLHTS